MTHKLWLDLLIDSRFSKTQPVSVPLHCSVTVFDSKSLQVAVMMVRSGGFGKWSKRSYFLRGFVTEDLGDGYVESRLIDEPLFVKTKEQVVNGQIRLCWEVNPALVEIASLVKR